MGKNTLEKDIHTQLDINQRLNIRVSELESQVKDLTSQLSQLDPDLASTAVAENIHLAQEKKRFSQRKRLPEDCHQGTTGVH